MNLFQKFKEKLSTSLKFVALLSVIFQSVIVFFLVNEIYFEILFFIFVIFYFFIIVIGISRYVEVSSKNNKEKFVNFFWLLNCFPIILIPLYICVFLLKNLFYS